MQEPLKYLNYTIVCQEIPNEISLAINISGCPHKCEGCHSPELWEYQGEYLLPNLQEIIAQYNGLITCVCFMGGDQNEEEIIAAAEIVHSNELKCAAYFGCDDYNPKWKGEFDYLKLGHYDQKLGGLNSITTNQKLCRLKGKLPHPYYEDITRLMQKQALNPTTVL